DGVVACGPDPAYRRRLARRVPEARVAVRMVDAAAESLPVPDGSVDTVVSTLTMCSVDDPATVAAELARILRPDGQILLFEHIRTDRGRLPRLLQTLAIPVWYCFAGGCRLNRPTLDTLRVAGFEVSVLETLYAPHTPRLDLRHPGVAAPDDPGRAGPARARQVPAAPAAAVLPERGRRDGQPDPARVRAADRPIPRQRLVRATHRSRRTFAEQGVSR